jgi:hypothetical protein
LTRRRSGRFAQSSEFDFPVLFLSWWRSYRNREQYRLFSDGHGGPSYAGRYSGPSYAGRYSAHLALGRLGVPVLFCTLLERPWHWPSLDSNLIFCCRPGRRLRSRYGRACPGPLIKLTRVSLIGIWSLPSTPFSCRPCVGLLAHAFGRPSYLGHHRQLEMLLSRSFRTRLRSAAAETMTPSPSKSRSSWLPCTTRPSGLRKQGSCKIGGVPTACREGALWGETEGFIQGPSGMTR